MRNLKRVLALALALVMMLGMMITANAATYADAAAIDEDYAEAVEILTGMGVFKGQGTGFAPKATLTRAEAAALIYRVITADVTDSKIDLYDYASFDDVAAGAWSTGYITYAANGGYVKGDGTGNFNPNDTVTGVQVLAIMLRAAGYGQNGEYEGAAWMDNILTDAQDLGLLAGVNVKSLAVPATREVVAQLIFNAMTKAFIVTYTPALGYIPVKLTTLTGLQTLAVKNFYLESDDTKVDAWGRPSTIWFADKDNDGTKDQNEKLYANIEETPIATYTTAVAECQIASDMGLDGNKEYDVTAYTNGTGTYNVTTIKVNPIDVATKIGAQGRLLEVYEDRIVMIDTFLATVDAVKPATFDNAGHLKSEAALYLTVYDRTGGYKIVMTNGADNYTYTTADKLLVNVKTYNPASGNTIDLATAAIGTGYGTAKHIEIVGVASTIVGAQDYIWHNVAKHTVAGTVYDDAAEFHKNDAGNVAKKQFTWAFDQYGNLIGSFTIQNVYTYATIKEIQWINPTGAYGYAQATLVYVDGTTEAVVIDGIDKNGDYDIADQYEVLTGSAFYGDYENGTVSINWGYNAQANANESYLGKHLFAVSKADNGVATLSEIKTVVTNATVDKGNPVVSGTGTCYVDDSTLYLIRTGSAAKGYTWTSVPGYNQITSLTAATVYYVNLDNDAAAEYVYMFGTPATTAASNIVYVNEVAYNYVPGSQDYTLLDAYIKGVNAPVVMDDEWFDNQYTDVARKTLYYMVDGDGNGVIDNLTTASGDAVTNLLTTNLNLSDGTKSLYLTAGSYSVLNNAIEVTGQVVPYNTILAETFNGTVTGAENIVIIYKNYNVSAIYVIA